MGVRLLIGQIGGEIIMDALVTRNGTFASTQQYTTFTPGISGNVPAGGRFGISLESADVDGNGYPDIIAGLDSSGVSGEGAVYIMFRNASNYVINVMEFSEGVNGMPPGATGSSQGFGYQLAWIGAWGDGTNVLAVGGGFIASNGAVYLFGMASNGTFQWYQKLESGEHGLPSIAGPPALGSGLAAVDLDSTLPMDLVVSQAGNSGASKVWLMVLDQAGRNVSQYLRLENG